MPDIHSRPGPPRVDPGGREDAMRNPNDTRDVVPRFGSPPWIYIAAVSVAGAAVLGVAAAHLRGVADLANTPIFWVMAGMVVAAEIWPLTTPARSASHSPPLSPPITLPLLLYS